MKSNLIAISIVLAALSALVLLPISAITAGGNAVIVIGILAVFLADCGRTIKPLQP